MCQQRLFSFSLIEKGINYKHLLSFDVGIKEVLDMILALEVFTMKSKCKNEVCTCEIRNDERMHRVKHELCSVDSPDV